MEEEEFRPAFREPVLAYGLASTLLWLLVFVTSSLLPLPGFVVTPVQELAGLSAAIFFAFRSVSALELHEEERYYVGEGVLRIGRDRVFSPVTVLLQNVTEVRVETPLLMRVFGIGTVWVYTFDCRAHPLYNLKDAKRIAEKIRPSRTSEPVFRPSVG